MPESMVLDDLCLLDCGDDTTRIGGVNTVAVRQRLGIHNVELVGRVVDILGGRYSTELGIDVDGGEAEVERWFVAATLFGSRISASVAERTFQVLDGAGLTRIAGARNWSWDDLVARLDEGGYARYDFRTATRLQALADIICDRYGGRVAGIGETSTTYPMLRDALDALPGWGPVTLQLFLRELRGVWPGADPPFADRAERAARHVGLVRSGNDRAVLRHIGGLAAEAGLDRRDLESGLVRLVLAHGRSIDTCPGGAACTVLRPVRSAETDER